MRQPCKVWRASVLLAAIVTLALMGAGCGSSGGSTKSGASGSSLHLMHQGELIVGAEMPVKGFIQLPYSNPSGFEVDLVKAWAKEMKIPKVKWVDAPFANLFSPAPKNFDMSVQEVTITSQRAKVVEFSDPYFDANQGLLLRKGTPPTDVKSFSQLKNLQFGYQATTTGGDYITSKIKPSKSPLEYSTLGAATQALLNGQTDAFVMDVPIDAQIHQQFPSQLALIGQFKTGEQYGVVFQKGNPLVKAVNKAIAATKADGTIKRLQHKWFPGTEHLPTFTP